MYERYNVYKMVMKVKCLWFMNRENVDFHLNAIFQNN